MKKVYVITPCYVEHINSIDFGKVFESYGKAAKFLFEQGYNFDSKQKCWICYGKDFMPHHYIRPYRLI